MNYNNICEFECIGNSDRRNDLISKIKNVGIDILKEMPLSEFDDSKLFYAPVGNYPDSPIIIICGKTTSDDSRQLFWQTYKETRDLQKACFRSPYSNMKDNLFEYLNEMGLFKYLKRKLSYWAECHDDKNLKQHWDKIFEDLDCSLKSGIQITQAVNCAILNNCRSKRSSEPKKKTIRQYEEKANCFFKGFRITDSLKLIILLGTPSNVTFYQGNYLKKDQSLYEKTISITHPSRNNQIVFSNLKTGDWKKMGRKGNNAKQLFDTACKKIESLQ